jgi:hypothetical protein
MDGIGNPSGLLQQHASRPSQQTALASSTPPTALAVHIEVVKSPDASESGLSARTKPCRNPRQLFWDEHVVVHIPRANEILIEPTCLLRMALVTMNSAGETEVIAIYQKPAREFLHMYFNSQGSLVLPQDTGAARHECIAPLIAVAPASLFGTSSSSISLGGGADGSVGSIRSPGGAPPLLQTIRLRLGLALVRVGPKGDTGATSLPPPTQSCKLFI